MSSKYNILIENKTSFFIEIAALIIYNAFPISGVVMLKFDWIAFWLVFFSVLAIFFVFRRKRKKEPSSLYFSDLGYFEGLTKTWRIQLASLPHLLNILSLILFLIAFVDPHFMLEVDNKDDGVVKDDEKQESISLPREGIAIYLVLDRSGSMREEMSDGRSYLPRIEVLKNVTGKFVQGDDSLRLGGRHNDLIGLVSFARIANVEVPLTLEHDIIMKNLSKITAAKTNQENGTAIGYALFKTANLIKATKHFSQDLIAEGKPSYDISSTVIVLVTDGIQETNPADEGHSRRAMTIPDAVKDVAEAGIKVYVVNINPDILHPHFAKAKHELEKIALDTGGKFYIADDPSTLVQIYRDIDKLEVSSLPQENVVNAKIREKDFDPERYNRVSLYPYFIGLGLVSLLFSIILSTTYLRKVP